jgi:Tfp pilus assembly protein PilF
MSSRNKRAARHAERADTHAELSRDAPSGFACWLLPAIALVLAGAALTILIVRNYTGDLRPPAGASLEKEHRTAPLAAGTNQPFITSAVTNQPEAETGEDRVVALVTEGNQFLARGNYAEAAHRYEQALRLEPGDEDLHYNLAIALAKLGETEEAKKHYAVALQIFPDYGDAHNNLGNLLMMENKPAEGTDHFREAVRIMPDNASFHNNLGTALGLQGKAAEALGEFAEAVKLKTNYVEARVNLANACLAEGRVEEAVAQLDEVLRLKSDFQPAIQTMRRARQKQGLPSLPGNK